MNLYSPNSKQQKQQPVANADSEKRNAGTSALQAMASSSPQVKQLKEYQNMADTRQLKQEDVRSVPVIQRYTDEKDGSKLSQQAELVWYNAQTLYAGKSQFQQANGIVNGQILFTPGAAHAHFKDLNFVLAEAKEGSPLKKKTDDYVKDGVEAREIKGVPEQALGWFEIALGKQYIRESEEHQSLLQKIKITPKEDKQKLEELDDAQLDLEGVLENKAEEEAADLFEESSVKQGIDKYFKDNEDMAHRPLMRSDCGEMAAYVAGFDVVNGVETEDIAAGIVYQILPNRLVKKDDSDDESDDGIEWTSHYATIIMTDGPDHVTMENAGAKASDKFSKKTYDRTWSFKMYGPDNGQTFDDEYAKDLGY